jgi:putative tricarboxylic transport membrane protein
MVRGRFTSAPALLKLSAASCEESSILKRKEPFCFARVRHGKPRGMRWLTDSKRSKSLMKKADLITGVFLLILSGYVINEALGMTPSRTFGPGSGFLPLWLGVILAVLSLILLAGAALRATDEQDHSPFPGKTGIIAVVKVLGGLALFTLLMETAGFITSIFLFVAYLMKVVERERWPMTALIAVLTTAGLYIVFHVLLGVTLPRNMFGF